MDEYHDKSGWGSGAIILLFVFLLILFAVFSGRGFGHNEAHAGGGHGYYPGAAYPPYPAAYAGYGSCGVAGYPPGWQIEKDFGCVKDTVKDGDYCLSKQIAETAACAETRYYQDRLADKAEENNTLKLALMKKDIECYIGDGLGKVDKHIYDVECKMLKKPEVEALCGLQNISCTNVPPFYPPHPPYPPYGPFGGYGDKCCNPVNI